MRVAILDDYQRVALASAKWPEAEITVFTDHIDRTDALVSALQPFDVIVAMRERTPFNSERLSLLPLLKLLVTTGMANAAIDLTAARDRGITVCGTGGTPAATAELTWGLILAVARHIPEEDRYLRLAGSPGGATISTAWQRTIGTGLHGKTLGLVGLGNQGRQVAKIGRAFGMKLLAWSQHLDPAKAEKAHCAPVSKEELLARSDVVTVHYKLSERSTGLIGAADLAQMKPTAYLINTSRGPIVDESALVAALRSGTIAGAGSTSTTSSPCRSRIRCGGCPTWCSPRTWATSPTTPTRSSSAKPPRTSRRSRRAPRSASSAEDGPGFSPACGRTVPAPGRTPTRPRAR